MGINRTGIAAPGQLNQTAATGYNPDQHSAFAPANTRVPQGLNMQAAGAYQRPQGPGPMMNPMRQQAPVATEIPGAGRLIS